MVVPTGNNKIRPEHLERTAEVYIRESNISSLRLHPSGVERQYEMSSKAVAFGWSKDKIHTVDEDLGVSGASVCGRDGFKKMLAEVILGNVGAIFCTEVSRLARDNSDFQYLLKACAMSGTLIIDDERVYDLSYDDDRLVLGIKGTLFVMERQAIKARTYGARLLKIRKGEMRMVLPIGYQYDRSDKIIMDPDEEIQQAIRLVFKLFEQHRSAYAVVKIFNAKKLLFPSREGGAHEGDVVWKSLTRSRVWVLLRHPIYTGAYVYGRTKTQTKIVPDSLLETKQHTRWSTPEEWTVVIHDHHAGYITWKQHLDIREQLGNNQNSYLKYRNGAVRSGCSLLQGIILCDKCGYHMSVDYNKKNKTHYYQCRRERDTYVRKTCQHIRGRLVDQAISEHLMEAIMPAKLEIVINAWGQIKSQEQDIERQRQLCLEHAEYEANLIQRRYNKVDPENRRVARVLERELEEKLGEVERIKRENAELKKLSPLAVSPAEREHFLSCVQDFPKIWQAETTTNMQRKLLLRCLIKDITICRTASLLHLRIHWQTDAYTEIDVPLTDYKELKEQIRELVVNHTDEQIAEHFNGLGLSNKQGRPFRGIGIWSMRKRAGIPTQCPNIMRRSSSGQRGDGCYTTAKAAALLNVSVNTIHSWVLEGRIQKASTKRNCPVWVMLTTEQINELRKIRRTTADGVNAAQLAVA